MRNYYLDDDEQTETKRVGGGSGSVVDDDDCQRCGQYIIAEHCHAQNAPTFIYDAFD